MDISFRPVDLCFSVLLTSSTKALVPFHPNKEQFLLGRTAISLWSKTCKQGSNGYWVLQLSQGYIDIWIADDTLLTLWLQGYQTLTQMSNIYLYWIFQNKLILRFTVGITTHLSLSCVWTLQAWYNQIPIMYSILQETAWDVSDILRENRIMGSVSHCLMRKP